MSAPRLDEPGPGVAAGSGQRAAAQVVITFATWNPATPLPFTLWPLSPVKV